MSDTALWYFLLTLAVFAMAWGGPFFVLLDSPPILAVFWRLTMTSAFMLPGLVYDLRKADAKTKGKWKASLPWLCFNGIVLAAHFSTFSASLSTTSFSHCMLLVAVTPILMVSWTAIVYSSWRFLQPPRHPGLGVPGADNIPLAGAAIADIEGQVENPWASILPVAFEPEQQQAYSGTKDDVELNVVTEAPAAVPADTSKESVAEAANVADDRIFSPIQKAVRFVGFQKDAFGDPASPTRYEIIGTIIAFLGICVLIMGSETANRVQREATVGGDILAIAAAGTVAVYLIIGAMYRKWMTIWMYAFPVTFVATLGAAIFAAILERPAPADFFTWTRDSRIFWLAVGAGFVPGIFGHTLANLSLRRINPLVLSITQLFQPLVSGIYGYILGFQGMPSISTVLAAPLLLAGLFMVIIGSKQGLASLRNSPVCRRITGKSVSLPSSG